MQPRDYKNLVPDSPLHRELEQFLRQNAGQASLAAVCEQVLQLPCPDPAVAAILVGALIEGDHRIQLRNSGVEWMEPAVGAWDACERFAVIDLETTNGTRHEQRVIEIGVCRVEAGQVKQEWASLVNPERPIPYWVRQLTGITDAAVRQAPRFTEILPRLLDDLEDSILVAHHARFDVSCLNTELSRLWGKRLSNPYLCTVEMSRRFLPGSDNYRLETLSQWLGLTHTRPHRADSDARATAELLCHLLDPVGAPWRDFLRPRAVTEPEKKTAETKPGVST